MEKATEERGRARQGILEERAEAYCRGAGGEAGGTVRGDRDGVAEGRTAAI